MTAASRMPAPARTGEQPQPRPFTVTAAQREAISAVPHFADGAYGTLPVAETLEFYRKRYVDQLPKFRAVDADTVVADIGAGYGWLAMAFAAYSPAKVIAVEMDAERLAAGRRIAEILGLADRITWLAARPRRRSRSPTAASTSPIASRCWSTSSASPRPSPIWNGCRATS